MDQRGPLGYLGGGIMTRGENLARQEEYDKIMNASIPGTIYSPIANKSINDKSNMTEEENNHLAEKIVDADVDRLWNSDYTVMCPEQSAIGTMCEMGILYGWKYMADKLMQIISEKITSEISRNDFTIEQKAELFDKLQEELIRISYKKNYAHYFDIRTNHLNEKDWRRSFSINQFLYGIILRATADRKLHNSFDEIIPILQKEYKKKVRCEDIEKLLNNLTLKTTDIIYCNTEFARMLYVATGPVVKTKEQFPDFSREGIIGNWKGTRIYIDNYRFPNDEYPHASILSVDNVKEIL